MNYPKLKRHINFWSIISSIYGILLTVIIFNIFKELFSPVSDYWINVKTYLLSSYITNTVIIVVFTAIFTVIIGVSLAWIVTMYQFRFSKFFNFALILPLAIPPYIAANTYSGMLSYTGIVQRTLRELFPGNNFAAKIDIMSIPGAIFIFTMFLYPYVYLITKGYLEKQSASLIEMSRLLGRSQFSTFIFVGIPIMRVSIVGGLVLVIFEVLNDYGVVSLFGVPTLSTAIFTSWFSFGDITSAVRLSAYLMSFVITVILLEKFLRGRKVYSDTNTKIRPIKKYQPSNFKKNLFITFCTFIFLLGFAIPTLQLLTWALKSYKNIISMDYVYLILNTVSVALIATVIIIIITLILANYARLYRNNFSKFLSKYVTIGYSIPGAIISIVVISFFVLIDNKLYWFYQLIDPETKKLVLSTSIYMLIFAYVIRFMAISFNTIEAGFEKVGTKFTEASRMLGMNSIKTFIKVDLPMIRPALIGAVSLIVIDIMKELPLTLILRPFNFETLATKAYIYAKDEMIQESAFPSLIIIIISFIAIYLIHRKPKGDDSNVY